MQKQYSSEIELSAFEIYKKDITENLYIEKVRMFNINKEIIKYRLSVSDYNIIFKEYNEAEAFLNIFTMDFDNFTHQDIKELYPELHI